MRIFSFLYTKVMSWSLHRHAPYYLYSLSFAESSFFPIPPDFMLAPMALAKPEHAWRYATWTTIASVLGGILGYIIGAFAFSLVHPMIIHMGYETTYLHIQAWFKQWGFWLMFVAGFAPIPYKLFTIAAGATQIPLFPFIMGSIVGRGGRFFLVTLLMRLGGERMKNKLFHLIDYIGWILVIFVVLAYFFCHSQTFSHLSI